MANGGKDGGKKEKDLSTKFSADNQPDYEKRPARGRNKASLIWEAMERRMKDKYEEADSYKLRLLAEKEFYDEWVEKSYSGLAIGENYLFGLLITRLHPQHKATNEHIEFSFPANGTPLQKFNAIMLAISNGEIPPDIGATLSQVINTGVNIQDVTELKVKIEDIEKAMKNDA